MVEQIRIKCSISLFSVVKVILFADNCFFFKAIKAVTKDINDKELSLGLVQFV